MAELVFNPAPKTKVNEEDREVVLFTFLGEEYESYRPSTGAIAIMVAATSSLTKSNEQIAEMLTMLKSIVEPDGYDHIVETLRGDEYEFDFGDVVKMLRGLIGEWSTHPTEPSTSSAPLPEPTGKRSTARAPGTGSTRSRSRSTASSTSSTRG